MPDNAGYYHVAYAATLVLYTGYALSLIWRRRALARRRAARPGSGT
jgi:hypothetical protein